MELALVMFNVGAGIGLLAVGLSVAYLAWRVTPLVRETRALAADLRRLARMTEMELRPMVARARELAGTAEVIADDAAVKVARLGGAVAALERAADAAQHDERRPVAAGSVESVHTSQEWSDR